MARTRRPTYQDTRSSASSCGVVKIKLLTGRKLVLSVSGPPPPYLTIEVPPERGHLPGTKPERGARITCKRVDVEAYRQMSVKELVKEGILPEDSFQPEEK